MDINITDAVTVARLILDMMAMYRAKGIDVSLETLDAEILKQNNRRKDVNKKLGIA